METFGVVTKGNGDAFVTKEWHTSLSLGGGQAGQGYPCVLIKYGTNEQRNRNNNIQEVTQSNIKR